MFGLPLFIPAAVDAPPTPSRFGLAALVVARGELGHLAGESGRDNDGPDVRRYGAQPGANWCAALVSYCLQEGATRELCRPLPVERSNAARTLWKRCGRAGAFVKYPLPGDVVCWWRVSLIDWRGHVGLVSRVEDGGHAFWSVEGNRGRFPSRVREYGHEFGEPRLLGFARLP
jgi:hypothetical protein